MPSETLVIRLCQG